MAKLTEDEKRERLEDASEQLESLFSKEFAGWLRETVRNFQGQFHVLESSIGALILGRLIGWRVLYLLHATNTIRKYEKALGDIKFRGKAPWNETQLVMDEYGPFAEMSNAYNISQTLGEFWEIVRGQKKVPRADKEMFSKSLE